MADVWGKVEIHHIIASSIYANKGFKELLEAVSIEEEAKGNKPAPIKDNGVLGRLMANLKALGQNSVTGILDAAGFGKVAHANGRGGYNDFIRASVGWVKPTITPSRCVPPIGGFHPPYGIIPPRVAIGPRGCLDGWTSTASPPRAPHGRA